MNDGGGFSKSSFAAVFPSIMLPMFLAVVDQTIVSTALPAIAGSLGGVERISWIVVGYLVATTVAAPVYGRLRDTYGGRRMMFIALAIFMTSSLLCMIAPTIELLTLARVLQGLGGGGLMTLSQALIGEAVPPRERARYQGYLAAVAVTSSTFGPLAGGLLTQYFGWRSVFLVNLPIGLLAVLLTARNKSTPGTSAPASFDVLGLAFFAGFIVPILLAVEQAHQLTLWSLVIFVSLSALGILSLMLLLRQEKRASSPLLQLDLLRKPAIWRSGAMAACHGATLVALVTYLPIYLHVTHGASAADAGAVMLPLMFGLGTGSMITGRLVSRTGLTMVFPSYGLIAAVILLLWLAVTVDQLGSKQLLVLLLLIGISMGSVMGVVQVTVQRAAGLTALGAAAATIQFSRSVGAAVGTAVVGAMLFAALALSDPGAVAAFNSLVQRGSAALATATVEQQNAMQAAIAHAFGVAFFAIAMFAAGGLALAWSHPERNL